MFSSLSVDIASMKWRSPLCVSSGNGGFAHELSRINGFPFDALGAICLKGTTKDPKAGNPEPRVWETACGLINSVGLENPGVEEVIENILPQTKSLSDNLNIIANVCGYSVEEYAYITQQFDTSSVRAIEINISCPNVKGGGAVFGNDPVLAAEVISACRNSTSKPLIAKLSPNQTDIAQCAKQCIEAGADVISAVNTFSGMAIDINQRKATLGGKSGGVSGSAIKPLALLRVHEVWQIAREFDVPVIGMGGIKSAEDVIAFFMAGASACGIGSALAGDTQLPLKIVKDLRKWLKKHGISHISELTGSLTI